MIRPSFGPCTEQSPDALLQRRRLRPRDASTHYGAWAIGVAGAAEKTQGNINDGYVWSPALDTDCGVRHRGSNAIRCNRSGNEPVAGGVEGLSRKVRVV